MTDLQAKESQIWNFYHIGTSSLSFTGTDNVERFQYFDAYIETPEDGDDNAPIKFRGEFVTEMPKADVVAGAVVYNYISWVNSEQE